MTPFKAKPTECDAGHEHPSQLEAKRCGILTAMESRGELRGLEQQPRFEFTENGKTVFVYTADFAWFAGDCRVIEDTKSIGTKTPVYRIKKKLIEARFGVVITEWPLTARKKAKSAKRKQG